jgi:hypothetical protein
MNLAFQRGTKGAQMGKVTVPEEILDGTLDDEAYTIARQKLVDFNQFDNVGTEAMDPPKGSVPLSQYAIRGGLILLALILLQMIPGLR